MYHRRWLISLTPSPLQTQPLVTLGTATYWKTACLKQSVTLCEASNFRSQIQSECLATVEKSLVSNNWFQLLGKSACGSASELHSRTPPQLLHRLDYEAASADIAGGFGEPFCSFRYGSETLQHCRGRLGLVESPAAVRSATRIARLQKPAPLLLKGEQAAIKRQPRTNSYPLAAIKQRHHTTATDQQPSYKSHPLVPSDLSAGDCAG